MEFDCFDIDKKKLIKIYVDLIMETLINLDVSNIDSLGLPIFIKDNKYLYYTKKVIDFFFADFYTETSFSLCASKSSAKYLSIFIIST